MTTAAPTPRRSLPPGGRWDRLVRMLKTALPAAAAVLFALCVLWPLSSRQDFSFILSKDRVETARERLRVAHATYRGEDAQGRPFAITAGEAVQRTSEVPVVELKNLSAELQTKDGPARASATAGRYDIERQRIDVDGQIHLEAAGGYRLDTRDVAIDLPTRKITKSGEVTGRLPLGTFRAARMRADIETRTVVLDGGAVLRIEPRRGK